MISAPVFEHAFDALPGACVLLDDDGRIIATNARFRSDFPASLKPGTALIQLYCDPLDALTAKWKRGRTSSEDELVEMALLRGRDGEPRTARLHVRRTQPGVRLVLIEPAIDTSQRELQLRAARQRVAMAFEEHSAGAYSADFVKREVVVSGLLERFAGPGAADQPIRLSRWLGLFHAEDLARARGVLWGHPASADTVVSFPCRMRNRDGSWAPMRHDVRVVERGEAGNPLRITGLVHEAGTDGKASAEAQASQARTRLLVDRLDLSSWTFDFETLKGRMEGPVTNSLGLGGGSVEMTEEVLRHRLHLDDAERVYAAFMGLQFGGEYDETFRMRTQNGHWVWHRSWGSLEPAMDGERRSLKAFGYWQAITARREDIAELPGSDIASVLDRAGLSAWSYDFTRHEITLSGPVLAALGLREDQATMTRQAFKERIRKADQARVRDAMAAMQFADSQVEFRVRTEGGHWIWLSLRGGVSAQSNTGEPLRASGVFAEATRRKENERRLIDSERLLSHAVSAATLGAWEVDYKSGYFLPRGEIRDLMGLDSDTSEWIPVSRWRDIVHPEDVVSLDRSIGGIMKSAPGESRVAEYRIFDRRTGTYMWVEARGSRLGPESRRADCAGIVLDISARKALEENLAASEERLARALESARQGTWRLDLRQQLVDLSEFGRVVMGLPAEHDGKLTLNEWRELIHPDDTHICVDGVARMLAGEPLNAIYRVKGEDGTCRWVEDRGAISAWDEDGVPVEAIGTLVDITRRRRLEIELADREQRLNEAMDAGLSAIWSVDLKTGQQSVRGQLLEWMGRSIDDGDIDPAHWSPIIHPDDREIARKALGDIMAGKVAGPIDYRLRDGDSWRWVRAKGQPTAWDDAGNPIRSGGVVVDITAEKQYADALDIERERLRQIYATTPVMLVSLGPDGKVLRVSEYWLSSMGYEREAVIGQPYHAFLTEESWQAVERGGGMAGLISHGGMQQVQARMVKADGTIIDTVSSATVEYGPDGKAVAVHGISLDITEKLASDEALKRYAAELERTNRELDRFAAVASHDLQEPLRKISAFASLIKRRHQGMLDPETDRSLEFLVDAAGRMRRLIDDLLSYSRAAKRTLDIRPVSMDAVLAETLAALELLIEDAGAQIESGSLPDVEGDPTLLRLLLQNLVSNALKYRKGAGVRVNLSAERRAEDWHFTVTDDGIGFDQRFAEKIFAPFQRLHGREEYEGTGIGLAICQQAVERHGGQIWVESEPGTGSSFHFTLPFKLPADGTRAA